MKRRASFLVDDYHLVTYMVVKFFKNMEKDFGVETPLPSLLNTDADADNEDLDFVKRLLP